MSLPINLPFSILGAVLLACATTSSAGEAVKTPVSANTAPSKATHRPAPNNLAGKWIYRSLVNDPDFDAAPDKLRVAVATLEIAPYKGRHFKGKMTSAYWVHMISGTVTGDRFEMRASPGSNNTSGWYYDYSGWIAPRWEGATGQVPTFVGTVMRVTDHPYRLGGTSKAGVTYTIYGVKVADH